MWKKMLFKFGLTVIVFVAVYMYFAIKKSATDEEKHVYDGSADKVTLSKDYSDVKELVVERTDDIVELDGSEEGIDLARSADLDQGSDIRNTEHFKEGIHLSVVACGDRLQETVVMLKSAVLFSRAKLFFHIFAEDSLQKDFKDQLEFWPPAFRKRVRYNIYNISFPTSPSGKPEEWKKLFKPCASQRLFIPALLKDVDSLLYVDTDIIFLSPIDKIWSFFSKFNSSQLAALAPEHEDHATGWYNRFARHPYYGELGVNSGVMLMNLTRLRNSSWLTAIKEYYQEYKLKITFGDQDLINIYFHFYPEQLFLFSCEWNYRPDHCMYMSVCKAAEKTGAYVLHGCRRVWHENKQPAFKAVYQAFQQHDLGSNVQYVLLRSLKDKMDSAPISNCGKLGHIFTTQIWTFVNTTHRDTHLDQS